MSDVREQLKRHAKTAGKLIDGLENGMKYRELLEQIAVICLNENIFKTAEECVREIYNLTSEYLII